MTYANDTDRLRLAWPDATDDDLARVQAATRRVLAVMSDGGWHTPEALQAVTHQSGSATTARIRDLRHLGFVIQRKRVHGIYFYRIESRIAPTTTPRTALLHPECPACSCRVTEPSQSAMFLGEM